MSFGDQSDSAAPVPPPGISKETFLAIGWAGTALSFLFLLGRIYARLVTLRGLFFDDFLVVFAWLLLLVNTIIWQIFADDLYAVLNVAAGLQAPSATLPETLVTSNIISLVTLFLFLAGLWSVKFSFLVFFRRLGSPDRGHKIHFWVVLCFTSITLVALFGTIDYNCLLGTISHFIAQCTSKAATDHDRRLLYAHMIIDVFSDAIIITIPVHLLWNVRINIRQKLALMGIFSLSVFVMVTAVARAILVNSRPRTDESWLFTWTSIEQTVSILVACLASFRSLFVKQSSAPRNFQHITPWYQSHDASRLLRSLSDKLRRALRVRSHVSLPSSACSSPRLGRNISHQKTRHVSIEITEPKDSSGAGFPESVIQVTYEFSTTSLPRELSEDRDHEVWDTHLPVPSQVYGKDRASIV